MDALQKLLEEAPADLIIHKTLMTMNAKLETFSRPLIRISGGSDSDNVMELVEMLRGDRPVTYVFFNTGMEYQVTKEHLERLESKYRIGIQRRNAVVPVPLGVKKYGYPFISKWVSDRIERLQKHGFQWEDGTLDDLSAKYPGCRSALRWWCNEWENKKKNISWNPWLKEFLMENPPGIPISDGCCKGAKKDTGDAADIEFNPDLSVFGLRKAEGGVRDGAYEGCFSPASDKSPIPEYRPCHFWKKEQKELFEDWRYINHSLAYSLYGLPRTGCACCPFGKGFEQELEVARIYEPNLYTAACVVFGKAYEYTRLYRLYQDSKKLKSNCKQLAFENIA